MFYPPSCDMVVDVLWLLFSIHLVAVRWFLYMFFFLELAPHIDMIHVFM
jgi:hypothetical protein